MHIRHSALLRAGTLAPVGADGDSVLSAVGQFFGGLVKGSASTVKASAAAPVASESGGEACADGSCGVK